MPAAPFGLPKPGHQSNPSRISVHVLDTIRRTAEEWHQPKGGEHTPAQGGDNEPARVYLELRQRIIRCEIRPGEVLVESRLRETLGATHTAVRNALRRLAQEGFIRPMARYGHQVTSPTRRQIEELFEFRALLEGWCAAEAAKRASARDIAELRAIDCTWNPSDFSSYVRSLDNNRRFHSRISELSGNAAVAAALGGVMAQITRALNMGLIVKSDVSAMMDEHSALIDALEAHDGERARAVAEAQVEESKRMVLGAIDQAIDLGSVELSFGALDLPGPPSTPDGQAGLSSLAAPDPDA